MNQENPKGTKTSGSKGDSDGLQYELCVNSGPNKPGQFSRITELENRIKMLESVLGSEQKDKLVRIMLCFLRCLFILIVLRY